MNAWISICSRKGELLQKYLVTICYPCVRYKQFWQKNIPTRYDQGSVILSLTLDRCALRVKGQGEQGMMLAQNTLTAYKESVCTQ